jgi:hypothetical protein
MSEFDRLVSRYGEQIAIPWSTVRSDAERTLFIIYDRAKERQLRPKLLAFQVATEIAGKKWLLFDLTDAFPRWYAAHPYRDEYFAYPQDQPGVAEGRLEEFDDPPHRDHSLGCDGRACRGRDRCGKPVRRGQGLRIDEAHRFRSTGPAGDLLPRRESRQQLSTAGCA